MKKTTIYLPDDLKAALTRAAERRGVSEAEIIREAVQREVRPERPRPTAGVIANAGIDASRTDEMLKGFGEW